MLARFIIMAFKFLCDAHQISTPDVGTSWCRHGLLRRIRFFHWPYLIPLKMHEAWYWINTASVKFWYFNQSVRCSKLFLVFSSNLCALSSCAWFNPQDNVQVSIVCESTMTSLWNTYAVSTQGHPLYNTHNLIWHAREQFGSQEDRYPQGHICS